MAVCQYNRVAVTSRKEQSLMALSDLSSDYLTV